MQTILQLVTSHRLLPETLTSQFTQFPIELIYRLASKIKVFLDVKYLNSGSNVIVYTGIHNKEFIAVKMLKSKIKNKRVAVEELNLEMQILA